ncbi:MAG: P-loop containing nucleoside triphosphate hydrolase [Edafosvirus sp.]|uniref:P-loop containing nucleoside triphosphate hydrolase n=1 Tax=Edafosvirus sp. TaxID=2487765 RepID=A0A3G4ZVL3_9VIRU|nr:MAG: P-loop containing nucleoside triphosphate hydrolase [Edafosvirus sp.]
MAFDYLFKIIIVGDSSIGKSSLMKRFVDNKFDGKYDITIGVDFGYKKIQIDDKQINIQIWDTAGQEVFRSLTKAYYKNAYGALLCFDVTNRKTFDQIDKWLHEINSEVTDPIHIFLVGNKCDLEVKRQVTYQEGVELAKFFKMTYVETSSKNNSGVDKCFTDLITKIYNDFAIKDNKKEKEKEKDKEIEVEPISNHHEKSKKCCF